MPKCSREHCSNKTFRSKENVMGKNKFQEQCAQIVSELGLANKEDITDISSLTGGVSSDIAVVTVGDKKLCVKCSLEQLRVAELWEAPLHRNNTEYQWLTFVGEFLPNAVPTLYGQSASGNGFVMAYCDPSTHKNWKSELMAGRVDSHFAGLVGETLGKIHQKSTTADIDFPHQDDFKKLRLEPYFLFTATKYPVLSEHFQTVSDELYRSRTALVHGDVSPKNILMSEQGPLFLDAECAVINDPAFDLSFCLNHLIIKMIIGVADRHELAQSILNLWQGYRQHIHWEPISELEARTCLLLPLMLLARVDGKSPVEYHTATSKKTIQTIALNLITDPSVSIPAMLEQIMKEII